MSKTKVQHASGRNDWGTSDFVIEAARKVLIGIDLDPASSEEHNKRVRAKTIITSMSLQTSWFPVANQPLSIFLNPPGGKCLSGVGKRQTSQPLMFWKKLLFARTMGLLKHAIYYAFSIEALQYTQQCSMAICAFPVCFPSKRQAAVDPTGEGRASPSHAQAIVYVPGLVDRSEAFRSEFSKMGAIMFPLGWKC